MRSSDKCQCANKKLYSKKIKNYRKSLNYIAEFKLYGMSYILNISDLQFFTLMESVKLKTRS